MWLKLGCCACVNNAPQHLLPPDRCVRRYVTMSRLHDGTYASYCTVGHRVTDGSVTSSGSVVAFISAGVVCLVGAIAFMGTAADRSAHLLTTATQVYRTYLYTCERL